MSNLDSDTPHTTEVRTTYDPIGPTATTVRRTETRPNTAAWWVAGLVAVVAIIAVAFMVTNNNTAPTQDQIDAAASQGRAEAMAANAQSALDSAQMSAQMNQANAQAAAAATQSALRNDADRAAQARADAEDSARRAARSANDSAKDASATVEGGVPEVEAPQ